MAHREQDSSDDYGDMRVGYVDSCAERLGDFVLILRIAALAPKVA